jgi:hypothetical protein
MRNNLGDLIMRVVNGVLTLYRNVFRAFLALFRRPSYKGS